jgi:murein DD-endopeptidase MepM/ murein hydrolase activator NlpD
MKFLHALILLSILPAGLFAQTQETQDNYPQGYFRNPLDIPISLAGNFAECRPNHFHTGLDLKTNEKENLKVYAASDGYVSRISISHSGYGNAIYITHPNGYTTLYGHLNDFYPALQQYLVQQQYAKESWNIDLKLTASQFPVKKGQFIAFSGTTGGSTGPHLHFEIRDSRSEHVLNAALFGLPITDILPPVPKSIALYNAGSVYEQGAQLFPLKKDGSDYTTVKPLIVNTNNIRVAVKADDYMNGSSNTLGVYEMSLYLDDALQSSWRLDDIDFDENRYVNAFADFKLKEEDKGWYQTLFRIKGNRLSNYTFLNAADGTLDISDGQPHEVHITLKDAAGNTSEIRFTITGTTNKNESPSDKDCTLWQAGKANELKTKTLVFRTDKDALYDDICMEYSEQSSLKYLSHIIQIQDTKVPVQSYAQLSIKLNKLLPFALASKLVFIHHIKAAALPGNNPQDAAVAQYEKGWAKAEVRTFGNYYVAVDTIPPVIKSLQKTAVLTKAKNIRFTVTDNLTAVQSFRAELDGKWLRFVRSGNTYIYIFDDRCTPGKHSLDITATDENDNKRTFRYTFTR